MENRGKLLIDVTVTELVIRFPIDLSLFKESHDILEKLVDEFMRLVIAGRRRGFINVKQGNSILKLKRLKNQASSFAVMGCANNCNI